MAEPNASSSGSTRASSTPCASWARDDLRSVNGQIEYLLNQQARRAGRLPHQRAKPPQSDAPPPAPGELPDDPDASPLAPASAGDQIPQP